ncbi:hypothetical protein B0H11DRAFT_1930790 [Mycena galericulata]|nr:hypothetical protein B0H11DRAFT_1930790 [Mycena galericulata]
MSQESNKTKALRRGKACLNCRYFCFRPNWTKCDGIRPICGQCQRVPKDDQCEYTDTMSRTQELEHTVFRLQSRIDELQGTASSSNYVAAPPGPPGSPFGGSSADHVDFRVSLRAVIGKLLSGLPGRANVYAAKARANLHLQEPPLGMIRMLFVYASCVIDRELIKTSSLRYFLPHATQFGFFLHPVRFHDATVLPLPFGDERRPSPGLLCVVYLWGVHLSQAQPLLSSEPVFLKRAQQHITTAISAQTSPAHILHAIQAQVLLSTYLFRTKHFLEAEFYANGAATLALGYQLHKVRSARPGTPPLLGVPMLLEMYPIPPADAVEEGERIRGFWAVACLQSNLKIALNSSRNAFCILESLDSDIDTPWPLEIADYEAGMLPPGYLGQGTIRSFLTDEPPPASPVCALLAKATVLLHRAVRLSSNWSPNLSPQEFAAYMTSYAWLDQRITRFWEALPPIYSFYADPPSARTLVVTHGLTAATAIRLHRSPAAADPEAPSKCLFAARAIIEYLGDTNVVDRVVAHPMVGSLGTMGCRVLMDEIRKARGLRASWAARIGGPMPPPNAEEAALLSELRGGLETMGVYAVGSPLVEYQLNQLRQQYEAM